MITGKKEELDQVVETHLCPEHGAKLVVAWHARENAFVIRCSDGTHKELAPLKPGETQQREVIAQGHFPDEVTKQLTPTQEYRRGMRNATAKGLDLMPKADLATGEALSPQMIEALYLYAKQYDLDAYRGHVMLMYGKPYIGIDGYLYHAYKEKIPFQLRSRPLGEDERKTYRTGENDHAWTCEVVRLDNEQSFTGLGVVTQEEMTEMSKKDKTKLRSPVVAAHPWQLAQKRAEWQALRRAFPIGESSETDP